MTLKCSRRFETKIENRLGIVSRSDFQPRIMNRFCHNSGNLSFIIFLRNMILFPRGNKLPLKAKPLEAALVTPDTIVVIRVSLLTAVLLGFLCGRVLVRII